MRKLVVDERRCKPNRYVVYERGRVVILTTNKGVALRYLNL